MKILVTGSNGFIGYHLCRRLLEEYNYSIIGIDNMNDYYDVNLKEYRLNNLTYISLLLSMMEHNKQYKTYILHHFQL